MSRFIKTHKITTIGIIIIFILILNIMQVQAKKEQPITKISMRKELEVYKRNFTKHMPGVGYYDAVKVLDKIVNDKYKSVSFDKLAEDSNSKFGLTDFSGLCESVKKNGLYSAAVKINYDELAELVKDYEVIAIVGGNELYSQILSVEENGVKVFIPGFANPEYLMPVSIFKKDWNGKAVLLSDKEINIDKSKLIKEEDLLLGDGCGNTSGEPEKPGEEETKEPVIIRSGKLRTWSRDISIPHPKMPLEIKRYYNASIESEVDGFQPDRAYGSSWSIEDGEYSGQGHITVTRNTWTNPTITVDMKTVEPGESVVETGCVNFCYTDVRNRYNFFIGQGGSLFIGKYVNSMYPEYIVDGWTSDLNPLLWNTVQVEYNDGRIKVYVNSELKIDITDTDPLPQGKVGLESHLSHSHFDNLSIQDASQTQSNDFTEDDNEFIFGYGWTYTYGIMIREFYNEYAIVYRADGRKDRFTNNGGGTYTAPLKVYDTLTGTISGHTLKEKDGTEYHFNLDGRLLNITDTNNNQITVNYGIINGEEKPVTITDTFGRTLTFEYWPDGLVKKITDDLGREVQYNYNGHELTSVIDARGNEEVYTYYPVSGNLYTIIDREGNTYTYEYLYNDQVHSQTDPFGNITYFDYLGHTTVITNNKLESYSYDFYEPPMPLLASFTDRIGQMSIFTWDNNGNLESKKDRNNNTIYYTWDDTGDLTGIDIPGEEDPERHITNYSYNLVYNKLTTLIDANGNTTTLEYDPANGNLLRVISPAPLNYETRFTYYDNGLLHTKTDAKGNITEYFYDIHGYLERIVEPLGRETRYRYDICGRLVSFTDANGNTTTYEYDNNNNLAQITSSVPFNYEANYTYNKNNKLVEKTEPNGALTTYEYDGIENLIRKNRFLSPETIYTTLYAYDTTNFMEQGMSNLLNTTDANGNTTSYEYDENNRLIRTIDAENNTTQYEYDNENNLIKITDANENYTEYTYSGYNRLVTARFMDGTREDYDYDPVGNIKSKTDRNRNMIIYDYDELNRLEQKTWPNGVAIEHHYDEVGNLDYTTDINGTIDYTYNELNRLTDVIYPDGNTLNYQYDNAGNRTRLTYPDTGYITYEYDNMNRLIDIKNQLSQTIAHYTYDEVSRRTREDLLNSTSTLYEYDDLNRLTAINYQMSSNSYTYDNINNCLTMANNEGIYLYSYDDIYRLTQTIYPDGKNISYAPYDNVGNRIGRNRDNVLTAYSYNEVNKLSNYTNNGAGVGSNITVRGTIRDNHLSSVTVNGVSAVINGNNFTANNVLLNEGENTITTVAIDSVGNTTEQTIHINNSSVREVNFTYDNNGNIIEKNEDGNITAYTYDYENRLIQAVLPPEEGDISWQDNFSPKLPDWRDNTTDTGWNCTINDAGRVEVVSNDPASWGHVYSPLLEIDIDQFPILSVDIASVDSGADFSLEVQDISGPAETWVSARTEAGIYTVDLRTLMGWSGSKRFYCSIWVGGGEGKGINLNSVSAGEGIINKTVQYKYDPFGRMIEKNIITNSIPEITSYVYDGANIIQETGAEYVYGPKIDEPINMTRNGETYYYERDRLGTITALTDSNGNIIEEYHYDPFGRPLNESDIGNRFMFTGREWDSELGLYYYRARYYDPEAGRFISTDPIGYSDGMNLYSYVNNNPVNWIDPWGLLSLPGPEGPGGGGTIDPIPPNPDPGPIGIPIPPESNPPESPEPPGENGGSNIDPFPPDEGGTNITESGGGFPDPGNPPDGWTPDPNGKSGNDYWDENGNHWHWHEEGPNNPHGPHWDVGEKGEQGYRVYPDGTKEKK